MDHDAAHDHLRKIRYWAARHTWQSDHNRDSHDLAQIANITEALKEWKRHLFDSHAEELMCLLLDAKDNARGIWLQHPLLACQDAHIRASLARYFYLVQAFPNTIPGVQGFFFHRLNWAHGVLSFQLGSRFESAVVQDQEVTALIGPDCFQETWITLPDISDSGFYDRLHGYDSSGWAEGTLAKSPQNSTVNGGVLESSDTICASIWGSETDSCKRFINDLFTAKGEANPSVDDVERGLWVLANMSWFLRSVSQGRAVSNYHYYFFRALPHKQDDFFHTSGQGLLSWASLVTANANHAARLRQAIALTACITLSRLSDAALPFYQRRAVTQMAQSGLGQKLHLMWALDNLVLPAMLGAQLQRKHHKNDIQFGFLDPFGAWKGIDSVPQAFKDFIDSLWPVEPWRPQCSKPKEQLQYLLALIEPLGAEGVPQDGIDSFSSILHDIKKLPTGSSSQDKESDQRTITVAQTRLAAAGALFVPAQKALHRVLSTFKDWSGTGPGTSAVDVQRRGLALAVNEFCEEFARLGKVTSLEFLVREWGDDKVSRTAPCGRALANEAFPAISLPFYITDLDLAYRALRDNWERENRRLQGNGATTSHATFRCCVLPNRTFVVCWREDPGWCDNFHTWSQKVWGSMQTQFASSRGLPFVLRFAAQNNAAHFWVRTKEGERESIVGEKLKLDEVLTMCCEGCPINKAPPTCYEIGIAFTLQPTR